MNVPVWVAELAREFWTRGGAIAGFPRELRRPALRGFELFFVEQPSLRLDGVCDWLRRNAVPCPCVEADRPLRACLAARFGHGVIFLDGTDGADEQRFSLAHELAHFLRHYRQPRELAGRHLGAGAVAVFDGLRPPTAWERVHSLIKNVPLGLHLHMMERGPGRHVRTAIVAQAEAEADRLAYELLAPAAEVASRFAIGVGDKNQQGLTGLLQSVFGFPTEQATDYARLLAPPISDEALLRRLCR